MGLVNFQAFHSIPNVDATNNLFHFGNEVITIPTGSYELEDLTKYLTKKLEEKGITLTLDANNPTLKCHINCSKQIDFTQPNSIGPVLGFGKHILKANVEHTSDLPVHILNINTIFVDCNITMGNYHNGQTAHSIYGFFPLVPPGFIIVEVPSNVIYLPINAHDRVDLITLKLLDQDGRLVSFRDETITITLHLRKRK